MRIVTPGWIDIQVNGIAGVDFNRSGLDTAAMERAVSALQRAGVTRFFPTVVTASEETMAACLRAIVDACRASPAAAAAVAGIHLEGPFISPRDGARGAHPREHVVAPDLALFERLQEAAAGRIVLVTLAAEWPGAPAFIVALRRRGVRCALGHTLADTAQIAAAVDAGAVLSTHLGNGIPATLPRHVNPLVDQLAEDRLTASAILDGHHLPDNVIRVLRRAKGDDRLLLTSDGVALTGMPPGRYEGQVGGTVELSPDGRLSLVGTEYLAGSASTLLDGVNTALRVLPDAPETILRWVTEIPARLFELPERNDTVALEVVEEGGRRRARILAVTVEDRAVYRADGPGVGG